MGQLSDNIATLMSPLPQGRRVKIQLRFSREVRKANSVFKVRGLNSEKRWRVRTESVGLNEKDSRRWTYVDIGYPIQSSQHFSRIWREERWARRGKELRLRRRLLVSVLSSGMRSLWAATTSYWNLMRRIPIYNWKSRAHATVIQ